jgi:hypothetical protein
MTKRIEIDYSKPIEFGIGWNCCKGNETHVIVFDNGARWAVDKGCASKYTGPVYPLDIFCTICFKEAANCTCSFGQTI